MSEIVAENITKESWGYSFEIGVCHACDGSYLVDRELMPQRCPNCFREMLESVGEDTTRFLPRSEAPEYVLPFELAHETIFQAIEGFARGIPYPPFDLNPENLVNRLCRVYLPVWLVDTEISGTWEMQAGYQYQVVSYQDHFDDHRRGWVSREVEETRMRWEPRLGRLSRKYQNVPAPALDDTGLLRGLSSTDGRERWQIYQPGSTSKALVRLPQRGTEDAWNDIQPTIQTISLGECKAAAEADEVRDFHWSPEFKQQYWSLLLKPIYMTYYQDDSGQPCPVMLNGQNGNIKGKRVASGQHARRMTWILIAVAVCIALVSILLGSLGLILPVLLPIGIIGLVVSVLIGVGALIPQIVVWQFNRSQGNM
jgi:hypothetical protein